MPLTIRSSLGQASRRAELGKYHQRFLHSSFCSKSLPPGVQENRKKLGLKGPKSAGLNRVNSKMQRV